MAVFREDFETGTTTMETSTSNGEVVISSDNPINGGYSARCRALRVAGVTTRGRLVRNISPKISEIIYDALIRLGQYNPVGVTVLHITGTGLLFSFAVADSSRTVRLYVNPVGYITIPRYLNIGEVYHVKVYLKCSSASGVADGAVTVWLNNEVIYENNAIDNSPYGLIARILAGCESWWGAFEMDYTEVSVDDITVDDTLLPPEYHTLSIDSSLMGVSFGLNGVQKTTPYSEELEEGSYTIAMPSEVTANGDTYQFTRWSDGDTNPTRTVLLNANISLVAEYELYTPPPPTTHQLAIDSTPIQGIPFTMEKVS